jgi:hypothetical protein
MFQRSMHFSCCLISTTLLYIAIQGALPAQEPDRPAPESRPRIQVDPSVYEEYERLLQAVLKTRRDEEKRYIVQVVGLVRDGRLPKHLVDSCYLWVRSQRPNTDYPFVYFEKVLRLRAQKLRFPVPDFDYSIYSPRYRAPLN